MADQIEPNSPRDRPSSPEEPEITTITTTTAESVSNETIAALINGAQIVDVDKDEKARDDGPQRSRRRSSVSIIQALVNTSHLLTTNDARKR